MSESADYDPGPWTGYDFKSARAHYDAHVGRSYGDAVAKSIGKTDLIESSVSTNSTAPLVIACDVTGSMGEWPATIFSKLPYLDLEGKEYLGEDMAISFAAVGDMHGDKYPLQVRPFAGGKELEARLKELIIEKGGGGTSQESYDLAALYYARNCKMPNAVKPIFIFIGDEGLYEFIANDGANTYCNVILENRTTIEQVMDELMQRFAVYLVRKPYGCGDDNHRSADDIRIQNQWTKILGEDHVCMLPDASRVVDVIFGILAKETGKVDYFKKEIEDRQKPGQVKTVMKSLVSIHRLPGPSQKKLGYTSVTRRKNDDDGAKSRSLLDD